MKYNIIAKIFGRKSSGSSCWVISSSGQGASYWSFALSTLPPGGSYSFLPSFLPSFIHSSLHSFLPFFLPGFLPLFVPSFLPSLLPSFLKRIVAPDFAGPFDRSGREKEPLLVFKFLCFSFYFWWPF